MWNTTNPALSSYEVTESLEFRVLFSTLLVFMLIVSVAGGSFVCFVIVKHSLLKKRIWIYLIILALSDVATAIFTIPVMLSASINEDILQNRWLCNLNGFSMTFCFLWSIHILVVISVDKYVTISKPFQSLQRDGNRAVIAILFAMFALATCLAGAPLIGFSRYTHLRCRKWCVNFSSNWNQDILLSVCLSLSGYVIPVIVIIYSSVGIYLVVKRQRSARINLRCPGSIDGLTNGKDVLVKTIIFLICAFLICWTPGLIFIILGIAHIPIPLWYSHLAYLFFLLQGNINPIIYCFKHACFKQELKKLFFSKKPITLSSNQDGVESRERTRTVSTIWVNLPSPFPLRRLSLNSKDTSDIRSNLGFPDGCTVFRDRRTSSDVTLHLPCRLRERR